MTTTHETRSVPPAARALLAAAPRWRSSPAARASPSLPPRQGAAAAGRRGAAVLGARHHRPEGRAGARADGREGHRREAALLLGRHDGEHRGGASGKTKADAAWFANAKYLLSDPQGQARVKLQEKIMLSPITVGVSESAAKKLGWDDPATAEKVTWKTITKAAAEGKLSYALSNPGTSNQGFMALMGVVAAASDKADALAAADVDRGAIASFLKGYKLVGDNSTYLAEKFIEGQGPRLNAFINYESWLLTLNNGGKLKEKLVLVYPKEGVSTADYPFMLLQDARRADYQKVVAYLKGGEAQTWLARQTLRRPISGEVAGQVADLFPKAGGTLVELAFSPDRQLSDGLIDAYLNEFRRPIASTFVHRHQRQHGRPGPARAAGAGDPLHLRRRQLAHRPAGQAHRPRAGLDAAVLRPAARDDLLRAARRPHQGARRQVQEDSEAKQKVLGDVRDYADRLSMSGGTALYDSVLVALEHMLAERKKNPATSIRSSPSPTARTTRAGT
jgi:Ca-activated chloride channel family protein